MKNIKSKTLPAIAVGLSFIVGSALAQDPVDEKAQKQAQEKAPAFQEIDRNQDGAITPDEAANTWLAGRSFTQADVNRDGLITQAEYTNATS